MAPGASSTDLPVSLYESVIDMVNLQVGTNFEQYNLSPLYKSRCNWTKQARMLFVKLPYTLATEEAERIGLDHVARFAVDSISINIKVSICSCLSYSHTFRLTS